MPIHPTAIVDSGAELGEDVDVGPYAIIGAGVRLGDRCRIGPHACLEGPLWLGEDCVVGFSAALGFGPQVKGNDGPFGGARVGARNVFREFAQVQRSMKPDGATVIGDDGFFMNNAHIAHDCVVGNKVVLTNNVMLGGHVEVGDCVTMGGGVGVHQFARVGELAMVSGHTSVTRDAPPFCIMSEGRPALVRGLNAVGLRRAGVSNEARRALKAAFRTIFLTNEGLVAERLESIATGTAEVDRLVAFIRTSKRGVTGIGNIGRAEE